MAEFGQKFSARSNGRAYRSINQINIYTLSSLMMRRATRSRRSQLEYLKERECLKKPEKREKLSLKLPKKRRYIKLFLIEEVLFTRDRSRLSRKGREQAVLN